MKLVVALVLGLFASVSGEGQEAKPPAAGKRNPIITASIFHDTIELVSDIADNAYATLLEPHVGKHSPKLMALADEHMAKAGIKKEEIMAKYDLAMGHVSTAKATLAVHKASIHSKLDEATAKAVANFDKAVPKYAGAVPSNFIDLLVFLLYSIFVLYVVFKIVRLIFRTSMGMFCFFCCCGCCRGKGKAAPASGGKKGGKDAKKAEPAGKNKKK